MSTQARLDYTLEIRSCFEMLGHFDSWLMLINILKLYKMLQYRKGLKKKGFNKQKQLVQEAKLIGMSNNACTPSFRMFYHLGRTC